MTLVGCWLVGRGYVDISSKSARRISLSLATGAGLSKSPVVLDKGRKSSTNRGTWGRHFRLTSIAIRRKPVLFVHWELCDWPALVLPSDECIYNMHISPNLFGPVICWSRRPTRCAVGTLRLVSIITQRNAPHCIFAVSAGGMPAELRCGALRDDGNQALDCACSTDIHVDYSSTVVLIL